MRRYGLVDIPDEASDIGAIPVQSDSIISGGIVTWSGTGLVFNVSACNYYIDGVNYNSPDSTLTLAASDPTNDRIDVFAVDVNGDAIVITGTPSANPQEPQTDPATQIKLTTVIVQATATTPSGVTNNLIYDENVEAWSKTSNSLTVDYVNTTTPYVGTYCILATTTAAATFKALTFYKASTYTNKADYDIFSFAIKLTQSLLSSESIKIIFSNSALFPNIKVGEYAITLNNSLGLDFTNTSSYQLIGIPMANITFTNNVFNYVQIQFVTSRTGISFRLDRILLQDGIQQPTTPTQSNSFGFVVSNSGTATATMPTDTLTIVGTGLASTSVSGKTLTIAAPSPISGTTNYISKFTPTGSLLGNSLAYDNGTTVSIGTTSPSADNLLQVEGRIVSNVSTTSLSSSAYSILGNTSLTFASGGTLSSSIVTNAVQGGTNYSVGGNLTIPNSTVTSSVVAVSGLAFTSNSTITQSQASYIRTMGNIFAMWIRGADVSGTVTHMSNLRLAGLYSPYSASTLTVSNYYGVIIEDAAQFTGVSISSIWGIYQEGINDNNYFAGKVLIGSNTVGTESLKVVGSAIISSTVTLSNLAGSGTRMVVADGSGVLSTQTIPSGGGMSIGGSITSATAGSVLFAGTSGVLAQDNANFFWDDTNNELGIGTNTPSATLHTIGTINAASSIARGNYFEPTLVATANGDVLIGLDISPTFTTGAFTVNTLAARFLDNVLVRKNSTTQASYLEIRNTQAGSAAQTALIFTPDTTAGPSYVGKRSSTFTTSGIILASDMYIQNTTNGDIAVKNDFATGKIKFAAGNSSSAQATLTAAGRLLLGTTTESTFLLDVNGTGRFSNTITNTGTYFQIPNTNGLQIGFNDGTNTPTTKSNISITNSGTGGIGFPQAFPVMTGQRNIFILGTSSPSTIGSPTISGNDNIIIGKLSISGTLSGTYNTLINTGGVGLTSGAGNTAIGPFALKGITTGSNNIHITSNGGAGNGTFSSSLANTIYIGDPVKTNNFATAAGDIVICSPYTVGNVFWFGGKSDSGDVVFNIPTRASSTNAAGHTSTTRAGIGTGTGEAGKIVFQHSTPVASGNTLQSAFTDTLSLERLKIYTPSTVSVIIGGTTANASALLQVDSTTKGFLPPRMTTTQKNAIATPAAGLVVYDTTTNKLCCYNGTTWNDLF